MNELTGAIKNAMDRGENLQQAKKSLINSGYDVKEIEEAAKGLAPAETYYQPTPQVQQLPQSRANPLNGENPLPVLPTKKKKGAPKFVKYLIIFLGILVLVLGGLILYFWDKAIF